MCDVSNKLVWYKLQFKQLNPIHIGKKNYGVLSETRLFIPGWTMWGALVNSYGRLNGGSEHEFAKGKDLFKRITCFYPKLKNKEIMFPRFVNGRLYIGDILEEEFRIRYTDTYVSTAIEPECLGARDASLHETEIILPRGKGGRRENLYWTGLVGIEEDKEKDFQKFIDQVEQIFVGGDVTYGFGRMEFVHDENKLVDKDEIKDWGLNENGSIRACNKGLYRKDEKVNEDSKLDYGIKNYIELSDVYEFKKGKLEFIVQYDFSSNTPIIEAKQYCIVPGSDICINNKGKEKFILNKGVFVCKKVIEN